jgi:hypothetical protein
MKVSTFLLCATLACVALGAVANASLTLTSQGINDGFTLSTFLSGYDAQYGPLAQGIDSDGNVITGSMFDRTIYVFKDVDNQNLTDAVTKVGYTCQTGNCNYAMTTAGGSVYGAQAFGGVYEKFNNDGTSSPIPNLQAAGLFSSLGMWTDPVNQHIISASNKGLVDIDPNAGTFRVINAGIFPDGVAVSPDGTIAYVAISGGIGAYDIASGMELKFYNVGHPTDGMGVISGGQFNGFVVANNNDGTVGLLDPGSGTFVIIADGGTRGDFVSLDTSNGTLFLSQNEQVARLTCGPGCSFNQAPEPSSIALLGGGILGALGLVRRIVHL